MRTFILEITVNEDVNCSEFYDYLHQFLSYDSRVKELSIKRDKS